MREVFCGVFFALLLELLPVAGAMGGDNPARLEEYMAACVKYRQFSGSVLVARNGKVLLSKGYGLANREHDALCTPQTKFRIGSISKPITALAIMILQEHGKLDVGDRIKKYLPDLPAAWDEITIHHLLTHSSGIPDITRVGPRYMHMVAKSMKPEELVDTFRDKPLLFRPGEKGQYSNSNYILLGMVIDKVSGQHYDRYLEENIFRPLGMKDTGFDRARPILKHRAAGYCAWGFQVVNAAPIDLSVPFAAGGLYSTTEDLFRLDQALYTTSLVSAKTLERIFTPHKVSVDYPHVSFGYGWGVANQFNQKRTLHTHLGGINGFSAVMNRYPKERASVIVLSNCEWSPVADMGADLAAIVLGEKYKTPAPDPTATVSPKILDNYTGHYEADGKIFDLYVPSHFLDWPVGKGTPKLIITITRKGARLLGQVEGQPPVELVPESQTRFFCQDVAQHVTFVPDKEGKVMHLRLGRDGEGFTAEKLETAPREPESNKSRDANLTNPATPDEPARRAKASDRPKPEGQAAAVGWTPECFVRVKAVGSVRVSPDGRRVVFAVSEALMDGGQSRYRTHIYLADSDGKDSAPLTSGEAPCYNPQWSPDGRWVAFLMARSGKTNLWLVRATGGEAWRLSDLRSGIASFRWSPDSKAIAFIAPDTPTPEREKAVREKVDARVVGQDAAMNRLFVLTVDGEGRAKGEPRQLTRGERSVSGSSSPPGFDWSPDGKMIAFSHTRTPRHQDWMTADIAVVDVKSGEVTTLASTKAAETSPPYSPDGRWIAFVRSDDPPTWADTNTIYIVPAKGGAPRALADTFDQNPLLVGWSAGSDRLYYVETRGTLRKLYALALDGRPEEVGPAGGVIDGVSLNASRTMAGFTLQTTEKPNEAYVARLDSFRPVQVSRANRHLPDAPVGRTEAIRWKAADGLEIEGLLTYPVGFEKEKRYPLLVSVHGGPEGVFVQDFLGASMADSVPPFAARGYAVLRCNVRGSSGYGRKFRYANYRDWGGKDFQDLMAGVDHVIALGVADPKRLGVLGWSYGGYLSAWAVTQTDRFRAASVGAGISDLVSLAGTADSVGYLPDYLGGEPWEKAELYRARSPLFHVANVRCPVLILHGENDERVPVSQGYEFYNALRRRGHPVEMVVYPRNGHGFHEPKFRLDVIRRNIEWFDRHVRAEGKGK